MTVCVKTQPHELDFHLVSAQLVAECIVSLLPLLSIVILPAAQNIRHYQCNASKFFGNERRAPSALNLYFSGFRQLDQSICVRLWPAFSQSTERISPTNPDQTMDNRNPCLDHVGPFIMRHLFYTKKHPCKETSLQQIYTLCESLGPLFIIYRGSNELLLLMFFNHLTVVFQIGNPKLILQKFPSLGKFLGQLFENSVILLSGEI